MPRKYYRKRTSKKGTYRKGKRSTFSYYKSRSSKAQAYQISKLDKRINAVYKNLGGEVARIQSNSAYGQSWPDSLAVANPAFTNQLTLTLTPQGQTPSEILYRGCYCNVDIGFKYPVVKYSATSGTTPVIWTRIIVIQYYQAGESYSINDFITNTGSLTGIFEPLNEDCGTKARILKDMRISIDQEHPERHFKLKFKRRFRIKQAQGVSIQKNHIQIFYMSYNMGADTNNISNYGTQCAASIFFKPYNYVIYDKQ